jgi:hypothetical protein
MVKSNKQKRNIIYPALMIHDLCGEEYIILMPEEGKGTVIYSNVKDFPLGMYSDNWGMQWLSQYFGEVILR